jgi:hypothetical protein
MKKLSLAIPKYRNPHGCGRWTLCKDGKNWYFVLLIRTWAGIAASPN